MKSNHKSSFKAFTLLEIIIVIAIIAALLAVTLLGIQTVQRSSRDTERRTALNAIKNEIEDYYGNKGSYPSSIIANGSGTAITVGSGGKVVDLHSSSVINTSLISAPYADITGTRYCYERYGQTTYKLGVALESGSFFNLGNDSTNECSAPTGGL